MDLATYAHIKRSIKTLLNINLDDYKDEQMRRRLDSWLTRSGVPTWNDYFRKVRAEPNELARLRNYLTINVSAFFRDIERWHDLQHKVLPPLFKQSPRLRIWSAGCSIGLEPYSLAMLLDELTPRQRHVLVATDLDRGALEKARTRGPYNAQEAQNLTPIQRQKYFEPTQPPYTVTLDLARRVQFVEHDLTADEVEGAFDLIICRNVVIYFTEAAKRKVFQKFYDALRPGGVLFIGSTEIISTLYQIPFQNHGISFYRKE